MLDVAPPPLLTGHWVPLICANPAGPDLEVRAALCNPAACRGRSVPSLLQSTDTGCVDDWAEPELARPRPIRSSHRDSRKHRQSREAVDGKTTRRKVLNDFW